MMNAKAISFTPEVLKAKLRALEEYGTCQTRRPCSRMPSNDWAPREYMPGFWDFGGPAKDGPLRSPFGAVGQALWVRERARVVGYNMGGVNNSFVDVRLRYEVDGAESTWLPFPDRLALVPRGRCIANGVFRKGARHFLEVVEVRAEVLHTISENDARLEGFASREDFKRAWNTLYQKREQRWLEGARELSPWCWVYTLKRATP